MRKFCKCCNSEMVYSIGKRYFRDEEDNLISIPYLKQFLTCPNCNNKINEDETKEMLTDDNKNNE